jgi:SAM-dependent methyltransferase
MTFDPTVQRMIDANQANWDARTPIHVASEFYGLGTRDSAGWFADFEWADLGDLHGRELAHLQCHLGVETMAFPRRGARTTGLDFSENAVREARKAARDANVEVEYVRSDVYDAVDALGAAKFDVVYTGKGALCYLPDLPRWAAVVAELLKPGGFLYIAEFHPLLNALGPTPPPGAGPELLLHHDYLEGRGAIERDATRTYTDGPPLETATTAYEWMHGLGDVITTLVGAGLVIERLTESELLPWPRWDRMVRDPGGWWRLPDGEPRIPLMYGLKAVRGKRRD